MARPSTSYEPRDPAGSVLHQIVQDYLGTFLARASQLRDGDGVPAFVERAFREFLGCGFLAGGFARLHCGACGLDRLLAFSCKRRALCPSYGGRRMAEHAAHLVEHVIPDVQVRQWVLTLRHRVRYRLAWDHDLCRRVTAVFLCAVFRRLRDHARASGLEQPRGGAVAIIQRFGGALNLNVHIHALVLDGVFVRNSAGVMAFHATRRLTTLDVAEVLAAVEPRLRRLLDWGWIREGGPGDAAQDSGGRTKHRYSPAWRRRRCRGSWHSGVFRARAFVVLATRARRVRRRPSGPVMPAGMGWTCMRGSSSRRGSANGLERVCRYVLRPPVTPERLALTADGQVRLVLRHPWADGTTHVVFDPVEFLGRLAVLVPRPRVNLILYYAPR